MEHLRTAVNAADAVGPERRRRPRYKIYTPAIASFNADYDGASRHRGAILDISENGLAIHAVRPLEPNQNLKLYIDLSQTNTHIQTVGTVVWSDPFGRMGISLPKLSASALSQLQKWMLQNALAACVNALPVPGWTVETVVEVPPATASSLLEPPSVYKMQLPLPEITPVRARDHTALLAALGAVQKEVASFGSNLEAALQLIAQRAQTFTPATGAAIALSPAHVQPPASASTFVPPDAAEDDYLVCHASFGSHAPSPGTQLAVGSGFSGQCVRSGRLIRCNDSETDPYADRESCRLLGIRSMLAAPICLRGTVVGILEVFSPVPNTFTESDSRILQRLVETVVAALNRCNATANQAKAVQVGHALPSLAEVSKSEPCLLNAALSSRQRLQGIPVHRAHVILLLTVAALVAVVLGFLLAPWVDGKLQHAVAREQPRPPLLLAPSKSPAMQAATAAITIADLRNLATRGDAMAQFALGAHFMTGEEVKQDYGEAIRWFTKAAEQGHVGAQSALGAYYWVGRGVAKDLQKAYFWSILARAQGDETSKYRVAVISSGLSRSQILAAELEANHWSKQHPLAKEFRHQAASLP